MAEKKPKAPKEPKKAKKKDAGSGALSSSIHWKTMPNKFGYASITATITGTMFMAFFIFFSVTGKYLIPGDYLSLYILAIALDVGAATLAFVWVFLHKPIFKWAIVGATAGAIIFSTLLLFLTIEYYRWPGATLLAAAIGLTGAGLAPIGFPTKYTIVENSKQANDIVYSVPSVTIAIVCLFYFSGFMTSNIAYYVLGEGENYVYNIGYALIEFITVMITLFCLIWQNVYAKYVSAISLAGMGLICMISTLVESSMRNNGNTDGFIYTAAANFSVGVFEWGAMLGFGAVFLSFRMLNVYEVNKATKEIENLAVQEEENKTIANALLTQEISGADLTLDTLLFENNQASVVKDKDIKKVTTTVTTTTTKKEE